MRIAYNLFTQKPKDELADFSRWTGRVKPGQGDDYFVTTVLVKMLVFSAADFEDFLEPRPELPVVMEQELKPVVTLLALNRWPFRLHATYDETITRALNIYEEVNREIPLKGLHWFIDHAETISQAQHGTDRGAGRRHRDPASHGVPGRIFPRSLWGSRPEAYAADLQKCCGRDFPSAAARTRRASPAITRLCRSTGW